MAGTAETELTLRLQAYAGPLPGEAARPQDQASTLPALPSLDPESLYAASLLKTAFPRSPGAQDAQDQPQWTLDFLQGSSAAAGPVLSARAPSGSAAAAADSLHGARAVEAFAAPYLPTSPRDAAAASKCAALHAFLERELAPLVTHFIYGIDENFTQVAVPAYEQAQLSAAAARKSSGAAPALALGTSEKSQGHEKPAAEHLGWWARRTAVRAGQAQARARRVGLQAAWTRAGLWQAPSAQDALGESLNGAPGSDDAQSHMLAADGAAEKGPDGETFASRGGALHGLAAAKAAKGGQGLTSKDVGKTKDAFRIARLARRAEHVLSTVAAFYPDGATEPFLGRSDSPTTADLLLFSLLAPVLHPRLACGKTDTDGHAESDKRWPQPYMQDVLLAPEYQGICRTVEAVRAQLWPSGEAMSGGQHWTVEERAAQVSTLQQQRAQLDAGRSRGASLAADDEPASWSGLAGLLISGAQEKVSGALGSVVAAFSTTPVSGSEAGSRGSRPAEKKQDQPSSSGPPPPSPSSPEAQAIAAIQRRRFWWIAGTALTLVGFVLASGIISIEIEDVDGDDEDEAAELEAAEGAKLDAAAQGDSEAPMVFERSRPRTPEAESDDEAPRTERVDLEGEGYVDDDGLDFDDDDDEEENEYEREEEEAEVEDTFQADVDDDYDE